MGRTRRRAMGASIPVGWLDSLDWASDQPFLPHLLFLLFESLSEKYRVLNDGCGFYVISEQGVVGYEKRA